MYARKMGPFIAPSIRKGATIPSWRKPATKVIVFQCPCGTDAISRSPRGQRPLSRTMFVLVAVSSINTSRAGSSMPCSRTQRRRARATSARFCSAACRLFFKADIVSIKETLESAPTAGDALFSHGGENLLEGQIRFFGNQSQDPVRVLFQWRNTPAAPFRRRAPCLTPALAPSNYRTNADLEDLGYLPPRRSAFNRFNRTLTQVRGIRPRHRFSSRRINFPGISPSATAVGKSLQFNADGKCSSLEYLQERTLVELCDHQQPAAHPGYVVRRWLVLRTDGGGIHPQSRVDRADASIPRQDRGAGAAGVEQFRSRVTHKKRNIQYSTGVNDEFA